MNASAQSLVVLSHLAATWTMVGVIWFVQVVHYPLFDRVGGDQFAKYEADHARLTTYIVAPPMFVELISAFVLLAFRGPKLSLWPLIVGITLLAVVWLSTALIQVPRHNLLALGFNAAVHRELVATNWIRTGCWSIRGLLAAFSAWEMMR